MVRFSPPVTVPERSSPSRKTYGVASRAPKLLPSAWTTPLLPSWVSQRAPRSRSMLPDSARLRKPPVLGAPWVQFRLTRIWPPAPCALVSEIDGADLVRVILLRLIGDAADGGAAGTAGAPGVASAAWAGR